MQIKPAGSDKCLLKLLDQKLSGFLPFLETNSYQTTVKCLTVTLEKTIPVAVKNIRG